MKLIRPFKEVENLEILDKKKYYTHLKNECINRGKRNNGCSKLITLIAPLLRNFQIEIRGEENIPKDTECIFVGNHSNSHDFFVINETFSRIKKPVTALAAWDGLNILSRSMFYLGNITFLNRVDKESVEKGILDFGSKILNGNNGFIMGESTWNLHPILPMQKVKAGAVQVSLITGKPIVPVIFEYVEVPGLCKKEKDLYSKCIVSFGNPIRTNTDKNIFDQTKDIQRIMEKMRIELWEELGISKEKIEDIDKQIYLNHLYLKKFKAFGFKYNTEHESRFLLNKENEYCVDQNGDFVPGILRE